MNKIEFGSKLDDMFMKISAITMLCLSFILLFFNSHGYSKPPTNYSFNEYKDLVQLHRSIEKAEIEVKLIDKRIINENGVEKKVYKYQIGDYRIERNEPLNNGDIPYYILGKTEKIDIIYPEGSAKVNYDIHVFESENIVSYVYDIFEFEGLKSKSPNITLDSLKSEIKDNYRIYREDVNERFMEYYIRMGVLFFPFVMYLGIFGFLVNNKHKSYVQFMKYKWFGNWEGSIIIFGLYVCMIVLCFLW